MSSLMDNGLWQFKQAKTPSLLQRLIMLMLFSAGLFAIFQLFEWWFKEFHVANRVLFILLSLFFWYEIVRILFVWFTYLRVKRPNYVPVPAEGMRVAVFTTSAPGEPLSMFENTLKALKLMRYPHTTYLLDSTSDPAFEELAHRYGVVFKNMAGVDGAKAGKINKALAETDEDFILILDPDHIVFPNFLDQTLGFFEDPNVGFVQVGQGYYNQYRSFIARGAAEQTYAFYGPTQMGLNSYNAAVAIGANCTFRRTALESIDGHAQGLAEDLQTSLRLHAKGWKSIYNPVIVSRGLVPEDFGSFCKQQLKWARGLFEVLFDDLPSLVKGLSFWQRIFYFSSATYYLFGLTTLVFILVPLLYFFGGIIPGNMDFVEFLVKIFPILFISLVIYLFNQQFYCDPNSEKGFHWRGMVLKFACWPVIVYAFILTLFRKKIPYLPTAKNAQQQFWTPFVIPLIVYVFVFSIGLLSLFSFRWVYSPHSEVLLTSHKMWSMTSFSVLALLQAVAGIFAAYEAVRLKPEDPWRSIQIDKNKITVK